MNSSAAPRKSTPAEWDVRGRNAIVTGGTAGIGLETAYGLAERGANVVITGRQAERGHAACAKIVARLQGQPGAGTVRWMPLDLGDFQSILGFAKAVRQTFRHLHILVHNAGMVVATREETVDGFEAMWGVNHMGPFTLNRLLLEWLKASAPARIVVVASDAHRLCRGFDFDDLQMKARFRSWPAYARSKLANILFARALSTRLEGTGVTVNALHPGVIASEFGREGGRWIRWFFRFGRPFLKSTTQGAATTLFVACDPHIAGVSGAYFANQRLAKPSKVARDDDLAEALWEVSNALAAGSSLAAF
jgi:NAD(P)-dependent dehydrogenase (short-subunit alcohol dehydrogenase family)